MSIQLLKKSPDTDASMKQYHKKLFMHRMKYIGAIAVILILLGVGLWGLRFSQQNRVFTAYEVVNSFERSDALTTQYTEFLGYVIKYGKDGISCVNSNNKLVWNQTYNMQYPMVHVCQGSVAVAEENGTEAMIFDETGLQGNIQTRLPIQQISVSAQGVLAILLEDGDVMRLNLYNKKGEELVSSKFELRDAGYPLRMSLSADATKLAVTFFQVQDGSVNSCLAFYNFDSVGENYEDHLVAAKVVSGMVFPSVQYMDSVHCFAVGTGQILLYEGKQIPELVSEITVDREIQSVFYSDKYIGLVLEGSQKTYALQVYNTQGRTEFETEFDLEYQSLKFSGGNILIYNEFECMMLNSAGKIFFEGTFKESVSNLYTLSGSSRYIVMHASKTDQIRLR